MGLEAENPTWPCPGRPPKLRPARGSQARAIVVHASGVTSGFKDTLMIRGGQMGAFLGDRPPVSQSAHELPSGH